MCHRRLHPRRRPPPPPSTPAPQCHAPAAGINTHATRPRAATRAKKHLFRDVDGGAGKTHFFSAESAWLLCGYFLIGLL
jgi:hypothetical protein